MCVDGVCIDSPPSSVECLKNDHCPSGKYCQSGSCEALTCEMVKCEDPLDMCEAGVCVRKYDQFCSFYTPYLSRNYCPSEPLSEAECPTERDSAISTPTHCGVTEEGDLVDFSLAC